MRMTWLVAGVLAAAILAGCGGVSAGVEHKDKQAAKATATATATATSEPDMIEVPVDPPVPDAPCEGDDGIDIPAVDIPEVRTEPVRVPDQQLAGKTIPGFVIPGVHIPAQRVPEQCAVREPAPAGCFGRVKIPAVTIPGVTLPGVEIPRVDAPGQSFGPGASEPEKHQQPVHQEAVTTPKECAQKVRPGEYRPAVYQPQTYRPQVYRPQVYRPLVYRAQACVNGECIPPVNVPPITVAPVTVQPVTVQPQTLQGKRLPEITSKCVRVFAGEHEAAYNVCSDVLFDFDKADIRPDAEAVLRQVARSLDKRFAGREITVDGHTDSRGSDAYNDGLSMRRAEAVKRWLVANGRIPASRITTNGYGESEPVATNDTDAGRQRNRRVVIGVLQR
jgi:outer membrane protein OmpA-like peptidoglycan-associated protein